MRKALMNGAAALGAFFSMTSPAWACPVCSGGDAEASRVAFLLTTALMSIVPLAFVGGVVYYLSRRLKQTAGEQ